MIDIKLSNNSEDFESNSSSLVQLEEPKLKKPSLYRVILLNDDYTPMEFVIYVLQTFFSYDKEKGQGSYILKMDPGSKSVPHEHVNYEEFYMLEGELIDADGKVFKKGDFVSFEPGTTHSSHTNNGCLILVFMRSRNKTI